MKYSVNFSPEKCRNNAEEGNVRMIVQWSGGGRTSMFVGHKVVLDKWSREAQRCKNNTMHGSYPAAKINRDIQRYEDAVNKVMQDYDYEPTSAEVKNAILEKLGKAKRVEEGERSLRADMTQFVIEQSKLKSWSVNTAQNFHTLAALLRSYNKDVSYADIITQEKQDRLITWLQDKRYKASTIRQSISQLNWFLRWAEGKGYTHAPNYRPAIKVAPKKVIYLTKEELLLLYNAELSKGSDRRARDFFCFCCFTGLRHSDAYALKVADIKNNTISIISRKDTDNLQIELNKYSREILERVELKQSEKALGLALPHIENSLLNKEIKKIAKRVGITEPVTLVYYRGSSRITETKPKWAVISSHIGRKTFICTALSQGISPSIIMKWTGHSNYEAMRPYIDIVDEAKKAAMGVFDQLEAEQITEQNKGGLS